MSSIIPTFHPTHKPTDNKAFADYGDVSIACAYLVIILAILSIIASLCTLYLIYVIGRWNGFLLLILTMTVCSMIYDTTFISEFDFRESSFRYTVFGSIWMGLAVTFWTNVYSGIVYYVVYRIKSVNTMKYYPYYFFFVMVPSLIIALYCVVGRNYTTAMANFYNSLRIISIAFNIIVYILITHRLHSLGHSPALNPVRLLASRMKYYPILQAITRFPLSFYQFHYGYDVEDYDSSGASAGKKFALVLSSICTPFLGIGFFIIFLEMQPLASKKFRSLMSMIFPCCITADDDQEDDDYYYNAQAQVKDNKLKDEKEENDDSDSSSDQDMKITPNSSHHHVHHHDSKGQLNKSNSKRSTTGDIHESGAKTIHGNESDVENGSNVTTVNEDVDEDTLIRMIDEQNQGHSTVVLAPRRPSDRRRSSILSNFRSLFTRTNSSTQIQRPRLKSSHSEHAEQGITFQDKVRKSSIGGERKDEPRMSTSTAVAAKRRHTNISTHDERKIQISPSFQNIINTRLSECSERPSMDYRPSEMEESIGNGYVSNTDIIMDNLRNRNEIRDGNPDLLIDSIHEPDFDVIPNLEPDSSASQTLQYDSESYTNLRPDSDNDSTFQSYSDPQPNHQSDSVQPIPNADLEPQADPDSPNCDDKIDDKDDFIPSEDENTIPSPKHSSGQSRNDSFVDEAEDENIRG